MAGGGPLAGRGRTTGGRQRMSNNRNYQTFGVSKVVLKGSTYRAEFARLKQVFSAGYPVRQSGRFELQSLTEGYNV